jgi:hypothetical protein
MHPIPLELYFRILAFSDRQSLLVLLRVSRTSHHEAERILYESVDLGCHHSRIYSWFRLIASCPRLAEQVHSLTFGIEYLKIPTPAHQWFEILAKGLGSLTHLKEYATTFTIESYTQTNSQTEPQQEEP